MTHDEDEDGEVVRGEPVYDSWREKAYELTETVYELDQRVTALLSRKTLDDRRIHELEEELAQARHRRDQYANLFAEANNKLVLYEQKETFNTRLYAAIALISGVSIFVMGFAYYLTVTQ